MRPGIAPTLTTALGFRVTRLALLFRRRLMHALATWDVTPEQWQVLAAVVEHPPDMLTQNDLAELTLKDRHSISRMVDRMERDGWLTRHPHPGDARASVLRPTSRARREVAQMREALWQGFGPLFEQMPAKHRQRFDELVQEMTALFELEDSPE